MSPQVMLVKNMVCRRCILAVENILKDIAVPYQQVIAGEIYLNEKLPFDKQTLLTTHLNCQIIAENFKSK